MTGSGILDPDYFSVLMKNVLKNMNVIHQELGILMDYIVWERIWHSLPGRRNSFEFLIKCSRKSAMCSGHILKRMQNHPFGSNRVNP